MDWSYVIFPSAKIQAAFAHKPSTTSPFHFIGPNKSRWTGYKNTSSAI